MKIYQDDAGWRVGDGVNQVSQVFPSEEAAKQYLEKRTRSKAAFDRMMQYPGKIIPVEWLEQNHSAQYLCERCGYPESEHPNKKCAAFARRSPVPRPRAGGHPAPATAARERSKT